MRLMRKSSCSNQSKQQFFLSYNNKSQPKASHCFFFLQSEQTKYDVGLEKPACEKELGADQDADVCFEPFGWRENTIMKLLETTSTGVVAKLLPLWNERFWRQSFFPLVWKKKNPNDDFPPSNLRSSIQSSSRRRIRLPLRLADTRRRRHLLMKTALEHSDTPTGNRLAVWESWLWKNHTLHRPTCYFYTWLFCRHFCSSAP